MLVSALAKITETQWSCANVKFDPVKFGENLSRRKSCNAVTDRFPKRGKVSLHCEYTLTLEAELIVFLAPEVLRLAVKRPQIRDVAMSPSTAKCIE